MSKQEVRKNRQRIRKNIITSLVPSTSTVQKDTPKGNKIYTPQVALKRRRKTSQDVRMLDDLAYLKQIYIQNSFQQMFQLEQKIGQGAHSTVFKCKQLQTGLFYAVKIFKTVEHQNFRSIKQHYRIKKALPHQNIIKAYYLFINQKLKKIHMVCQYCPYTDLRDLMKKKKKIQQSQIALIITKILNGLVYLHKHGVCHRDIKPQNILYNQKTGQLKIIDFQIAKMCKYTNQRLQMWTNTGTLYYKAPQMFNGSYNQLIDVWAVGVIAYELKYRKLPFQHEYVSQTIDAICQKEIELDQKQTSSFLIQFLKKTLIKNPLKRITSQQALHTPFLLKYNDPNSPISSKGKKHPSNHSQFDSDQGKSVKKYRPEIKQCPQQRTSYEQLDLLNQKTTFSQDIGIRFLQS